MTFLLDHDVPDDVTFSLRALGHEAITLRSVMPRTVRDAEVLDYAAKNFHILITCNRDDFLTLAGSIDHAGIIILVRRGSRTAERSALVRLLDRAGENGIRGNINFA